jgi:hypothetical protein
MRCQKLGFDEPSMGNFTEHNDVPHDSSAALHEGQFSVQQATAGPSQTPTSTYPTTTPLSHATSRRLHGTFHDSYMQSTTAPADVHSGSGPQEMLEHSRCTTRAKCAQAVPEPPPSTDKAQHATAHNFNNSTPCTLDTASARDPKDVLHDFNNLVADCTTGAFSDSTEDLPEELKRFMQV